MSLHFDAHYNHNGASVKALNLCHDNILRQKLSKYKRSYFLIDSSAVFRLHPFTVTLNIP